MDAASPGQQHGLQSCRRSLLPSHPLGWEGPSAPVQVQQKEAGYRMDRKTTNLPRGVDLRGDIAEQGSAKSSNICSPNSRGDVVISRGNVSCEWTQGVKRGFSAPVKLLGHILWNLVQGDMARSLIHHLHREEVSFR